MHRCYDCHTHLSRIHHLWDAPLHKLLYTFCYNSTLVWCTGAWCHTHLFRIHHLCDAPLHELLYTFFLTHHLCYAALHDAIHTCFDTPFVRSTAAWTMYTFMFYSPFVLCSAAWCHTRWSLPLICRCPFGWHAAPPERSGEQPRWVGRP